MVAYKNSKLPKYFAQLTAAYHHIINVLKSKGKIRMFADIKKRIFMKGILHTFLVIGLMLATLSTTAQIRNYTTQQAPLPCLNKEFSVVLHAVVDSTDRNTDVDPALIATMMDSLNAAFAPICAKFKICEERTIENFQFNSIDSLEQWEDLLVKEHQPNRINVFLVENSVVDPFANIEMGFATQDGITSLETGGIILHKGGIEEPHNFIHLMGHYFGLIHTFEGNGAELVDGSNCETAGDLICDTPADNYLPPQDLTSGGWIDPQNDCRYVNGGQDANMELYRPDTGNYMSYYGGCRCGFSYQQYSKMAETFLLSNPKMW